MRLYFRYCWSDIDDEIKPVVVELFSLIDTLC